MRGFSHDHPMPEGMSHSDIMEAVILAVAQGRGRATARTFSVSFASMMIATRRAFDPSFKAEHAEAMRWRRCAGAAPTCSIGEGAARRVSACAS